MEDTQGPPRVTALIVSRNCAEALRRCLAALERSELRDSVEVLVVDSGSTDGSAAVPADFPAVNALRLPKHFGRTRALNIACRTAKGEHILFLDPNVEVAPDTIPRLTDRLEAENDVGAVCPYIDRVYKLPDGAALAAACRTGSLPDASVVDPERPEIAVDYPKDAPIMVRRSFVRGMNFFDQRFGEHWPDLELCWQLRNGGKKILVLPAIRVVYHLHPQPNPDPMDGVDCITGAAAYLSKHHGARAGLHFRFSAGLNALGGLRLKEFLGILSGQKIDGTHA